MAKCFGGEVKGKRGKAGRVMVGGGLLDVFFQRQEGENCSGVCCTLFRLNYNLLLAFYIFPSADYVCRLRILIFPVLQPALHRLIRRDAIIYTV